MVSVRSENCPRTSVTSKMPDKFSTFMIVACLLVTCIFGQDGLTSGAKSDYVTDNTRLRVAARDIENRSNMNQSYLSDARFTLECNDTSAGLGDLRWVQLEPFSSAVYSNLSRKSYNATNRSVINTVLNILPEDGGYYACEGETSDNKTIRSERIALNIPSNRSLAAERLNVIHRRNSADRSTATLKCAVIMPEPLPVLWQWKPLGANNRQIIHVPLASVQPDVSPKYTTEDNGQKLFIHGVTPDDAGDYTCLLDVRALNPKKFTPEQTIRFSVAPFIAPLAATGAVSHIVGDRFGLICNASVYPADDAVVEWHHDGKPLNVTNVGDLLQTSPDGNHTQRVATNDRVNITSTVRERELMSTLHISELRGDDGGNYTCIVRSARFGEQKREMFLKVKDKFAALYPFLIILAEVILLVGIIFIYERRHNKKTANEYRADAGDDDEEAQPVNTARHA